MKFADPKSGVAALRTATTAALITLLAIVLPELRRLSGVAACFASFDATLCSTLPAEQSFESNLKFNAEDVQVAGTTETVVLSHVVQLI